MKKEDCLILAVWGVILIGIGCATYYGAKYYNNENVLKAIKEEKESLPKDKEINKNDSNTSSTSKKIINGVIKSKTNKTTTKTKTDSKSNTNTKSSSNNSNNTGNTNTNNNNTNNDSTSSNNNSNSSNNSNTQTGSNPIDIKPRNVLFKGTEEHSETRTKYGTIITKTDVYIVTTYDDNTTDKYLSTIRYDINRDGYNGNATTLRAEAEEVINSNYGNYEKVTNLINEYRSQVGASPLTLDRNLCLVATVRAIERAYGMFPYVITHERPDGRDFDTAFGDLGFNLVNGDYIGENITTKQLTGITDGTDIYSPEKAASDWYNSTGHRTNLQDSKYSKTGVGVYQLGDIKYWVQIFKN